MAWSYRGIPLGFGTTLGFVFDEPVTTFGMRFGTPPGLAASSARPTTQSVTPATNAAATSTTSILDGRGIRHAFEIAMSSTTTGAPEYTVCPASVRSPTPGWGRLGSAGRGSCDRRWASRTSVDSSRLFPSRTWSVHSSPVQYRNRNRPAGSANHPAVLPATRDMPCHPALAPQPTPCLGEDTTLREIGFDGGRAPTASLTDLDPPRAQRESRAPLGPQRAPPRVPATGVAAAAPSPVVRSRSPSGSAWVGRRAPPPPRSTTRRRRPPPCRPRSRPNSHQVEALGERFDGAVLALQQAQAAVADASARIDATRAEVRRIRGLVSQRAASVYRSAASGGSLGTLDVTNVQELLVRNRYAEAQSSQDDALLGRLDDAEAQLATQKADAEQARNAADAQRQQISNAKAQIETANAQEQQLLSKVQGELAQLVAQEQARRAAAALAAARARFSRSVSAQGDGDPQAYPNLPPNGPVAAAAIEFARAQLGKPYLYARVRARTPTTARGSSWPRSAPRASRSPTTRVRSTRCSRTSPWAVCRSAISCSGDRGQRTRRHLRRRRQDPRGRREHAHRAHRPDLGPPHRRRPRHRLSATVGLPPSGSATSRPPPRTAASRRFRSRCSHRRRSHRSRRRCRGRSCRPRGSPATSRTDASIGRRCPRGSLRSRTGRGSHRVSCSHFR